MGWSLPSTARAPDDGWPSLRRASPSHRHRRDQRCRGRGLRQRLGADRGRRSSPTTRACWPSPPGCATHRAQMTASQSRQGPSWTARFAWGAAAARRRRGAGDLGPVALGGGRAFPRGRAAPAAAGRPPGHLPQSSRAAQPAETLTAADAARIADARIPACGDRKPGPGGRRIGRAGRCAAGRLRSAPGDRSRCRARLSRTAAGPALRREQHQAAVATIVTASRDPVRLDSLIAEYRGARPDAARRRAGRRLVGRFPARAGHRSCRSIVPTRRRRSRRRVTTVRWRGSRPAKSTRRWPRRCACRAPPTPTQWIVRARRYIAAHRALDEIESAALLGGRASPIRPRPAPLTGLASAPDLRV